MNNIVIRKAGHFVDVFTGNFGWDNHTRFFMAKNHTTKRNSLKFISGKSLTPTEFNYVYGEVFK